MTNSDDGRPPAGREDAKDEHSGASSGADEGKGKKKTLKGLGVSLPAPRDRKDTAGGGRPMPSGEFDVPEAIRAGADDISEDDIPEVDPDELGVVLMPEEDEDIVDEDSLQHDTLSADDADTDRIEDGDFAEEATQLFEESEESDVEVLVGPEGGFDAEKTAVSDGLSFPEDEGTDEHSPRKTGPTKAQTAGSSTRDVFPQRHDRPDDSSSFASPEDSKEAVAGAAAEFGAEPGSSAPSGSESGGGVAMRGDSVEAAGGDFDGERTEVLDSPFESDAAVAKLHALDGPCAGQEFLVNGLRSTVGRGTNNSIIVGDMAMSRQHLEIIQNPDETYTVRDLQSVNGTVVNGTKVREADLFHGDRIEAGKTTLQFLLTGAARQPQRNRRVVPAAMATHAGGTSDATTPGAAQHPRTATDESTSKVITYISVAAGLISLALIAGITYLLVNRAPPASEAVSQEPSASQYYLKGVEAVKAREWEEAERHFEQARSLDPDLSGVKPQLRRIRMERKARKIVAEARKLADDGKAAMANRKVRKIPRESVYWSEGQKLLREQRKLAVDALYVKAQAAVTDEDFAKARGYIKRIREVVPNHKGARDLELKLEEFEEQRREKEEEENAEESQERRPSARAKETSDSSDWLIDTPSSPRKSGSSGSTRSINFTKGFTMYRSKRFDDAHAFFERMAKNSDGPVEKRAKGIADDIRRFQTAYSKGNAALKAKEWSSAERHLTRAKRADAAVAGGVGFHHAELSNKLAKAKANLGLGALSAEKYARARKFAKEAGTYNADDPTARKLRKELNEAATSLYIKAVNKRKSDPAEAAALCRNIMTMVPSSNPNHAKAKQLLSKL